ncbi:hypothetical protein C5167_027668 [Papaver somniferum]|nr:hypothetical protein C5167_027668 [Papaver somniferum]
MEVTRRRSHGFFFNSSVFATILCLIISLETASAWRRDLCIPGDIYMDSTSTPLPPGASCQFCTDWCDEQCLVLGLPQVLLWKITAITLLSSIANLTSSRSSISIRI